MTDAPSPGPFSSGPSSPGPTPSGGRPSEPPAGSSAETPEVVDEPGSAEEGGGDDAERRTIEEPAKIMRIGSMIKQMLEELRVTELDTSARTRLRDIYEQSIVELGTSLSPELCDELHRLTTDFDDDGDPPSEAELRMAKAQLVGWLEGLFQGIQATLISQQMAARQQLERMQHQLPPGAAPPSPGGPGEGAPPGSGHAGTYL